MIYNGGNWFAPINPSHNLLTGADIREEVGLAPSGTYLCGINYKYSSKLRNLKGIYCNPLTGEEEAIVDVRVDEPDEGGANIRCSKGKLV